MFAPEGYIDFSQFTDFIRDWAYRSYLAHVVEQAGREPKAVFESSEVAERMLSSFRHRELRQADPNSTFAKGDPHWDEHIRKTKEDAFLVTVSFHCMFSKALMEFDTLLASPNGNLIRPDSYAFIHMDRLDWVYPSWPLRGTTELSQVFEYFDQGHFSGHELANRYCFLDFSLGTLREKNNSIAGFKSCSHFFEEEFSERYFGTHVEPFLSRALVWNPDDLPDDVPQYFEDIGVLPKSWGIPKLLEERENGNLPKRKLGAKPTGAKREFFGRYPNGKPDNVSAEAIAAELTEAGFPISGRQILNYAKERKPK